MLSPPSSSLCLRLLTEPIELRAPCLRRSWQLFFLLVLLYSAAFSGILLLNLLRLVVNYTAQHPVVLNATANERNTSTQDGRSGWTY